MIPRLCFVLLLIGGAASAAATTLPEKLELEYNLARNGIGVGDVNRTLQRGSDDSYVHTMWTRSTGLARLLTKTEWHEEGEFVVRDGVVQPRRFFEIRSGDKRAYERRVTFDLKKSQIVFGDSTPSPMPPGLQDQGSVIYALMLDPPRQPGGRILPLTDGKDVKTYNFIYQGSESLSTLFGTHKTIVIRRISQKQLEREQHCRTETKINADCKGLDDFTLWLLPEKRYIPVKLERRRKNETTTMTLRAARGL